MGFYIWLYLQIWYFSRTNNQTFQQAFGFQGKPNNIKLEYTFSSWLQMVSSQSIIIYFKDSKKHQKKKKKRQQTLDFYSSSDKHNNINRDGLCTNIYSTRITYVILIYWDLTIWSGLPDFPALC